MSTLTPTQLAIVAEIGKALRQLGAGIGVQAAVGSWGDTLEEDEVLELLIHENSMDYYSQRRQELGREEFTNLMEKIFDEQGCGLPFAGYGIAESPAEFYTLAKLHGIKARHQRTNSLAGGPPDRKSVV